jgi:hypothetical protein
MPLSYQLKTYIEFNNTKVNILEIYDAAQNYRIIHEIVQCLSQHNLKKLKYNHIQKLRQRK